MASGCFGALSALINSFRSSSSTSSTSASKQQEQLDQKTVTASETAVPPGLAADNNNSPRMPHSVSSNDVPALAGLAAGSEPATADQPTAADLPQNPPFHIAIIGAGIGGLAFAIGCLKNNVSYTLYESASKYSTVGAGVGLGPNALRALELIEPALRAKYDAISSGNLTPNKDHVMFDALYAEPNFGRDRGWEPAPFGAACYDRTSAHRVDLLNILTSMIPRETVRFNKRVSTIAQAPAADGADGKVTLTFEDGEVIRVDAVVGSDGAKGPTRGFVLGARWPEEVQARYSGKYVYRSIIPMADAQAILGHHAGDAETFLGKDVNFITFPISRGTQCNLVAFKFKKGEPWTHPQWTKRVTKEEMLADFADNVDPRLVKLLDWAEPLQWSLHHHMNTPIYYDNRVCLLGDSAHATTPHQASGAGQCIEDALVLSHVLGRVKTPADLTSAFRVYDSIRRPRGQKVVKTSQEAGDLYSFNHPECGDDMNKIVANFRQRFLWIWEHDLEGDLAQADDMFAKLTAA
ncbi:Aromatic-ring hydroxylase-like protein [Niveomyces insectorum RCEF 264]|uniref:Aromatic-ring hydroxylase-like protein n=1 Tax=Niveomyces insectorum RCEF 264 TaxID=1081102 RepID=A0A162MKJ0_9HYPO|nr:Aromatic-ring hydroxylase-like protein [Niveomyces insectorum RCEF 264]